MNFSVKLNNCGQTAKDLNITIYNKQKPQNVHLEIL